MSNETPANDLNHNTAPTRRKMLGNLAVAGAVLGLNATGAAAASTKKTAETPAPTQPAGT